MEVDTVADQAPAEPAPSQTLYVHNLAERPRKDGALLNPNPKRLLLTLLLTARVSCWL
jgi:hypothetical protein